MKTLTVICASVLVAFTLLSVLPINGEAAVYSEMIRLHVLADSDDEDEQQLKLKVRDAILVRVSEITEGITDTDAALDVVKENLREFEEIG